MRTAQANAAGKVVSLDLMSTGRRPGEELWEYYSQEIIPEEVSRTDLGLEGCEAYSAPGGQAEDEWREFMLFKQAAEPGKPSWKPSPCG